MDSSLDVLAQSSDGGLSWNLLFGMPAIMFIIGGAIAISAIVATQVRGYHETKQLNRLKADMIARGFTADDIARVVGSSRDTPPKS